MTMPFTHLSERAITEISLGDRATTKRERDHLASCAPCRQRIQRLRTLRTQAQTVGDPTVPDHLLARIQGRIASGERVILPVEAPRKRRHEFQPNLIRFAAAAVVLAMTGYLLLRPSPELIAGSTVGELHITPNAPRAGDSLYFVYSPPQQLAREDSLILRARFRTRRDQAYAYSTRQVTVATLHREEDGAFHAVISLPDSAVFGAFAVEDGTSQRVDSRRGVFWHVLIHGPDGQPTYDALHQHKADLMGRDVNAALRTAQQTAELYPDDPDSWISLRQFQRLALGDQADRFLAQHRVRVGLLHAHWRNQRNVSFHVVDGILHYVAQVLDDEDSLRVAVRSYWRPIREQSLESSASDEDLIEARWWRLNERGLKSRDSARAVLPAAEQFWNGEGRNHPIGALVGWQIARAAEDSGDARRNWTDRYAAIEPKNAAFLFHNMANAPALRRDAIARLSVELAFQLSPNDGRRPLEMTRAEGAAADSVNAERVLAYLGDVMLAAGDTVSAKGAFERATASGWDVMLFRKVGEAQLALGDTANALVSLARVAADPGTDRGVAGKIAQSAQQLTSGAQWNALVASARVTMRDRLLARSVKLRIVNDVSLLRADSTPVSLNSISNGRVAVVTFWSTCCGSLSDKQLRAMDTLSARLARMNAVLVPVSEERPDGHVKTFVKNHDVTVPVYFDHRGEARVAFGQWAIPEYFVVDGKGFVRFQHSSLDRVLAQAASLQ